MTTTSKVLQILVARKSVYISRATLIATRTQPLEQHYPAFPYWRKRYNAWVTYMDFTRKRLTENSKLIVVDGNLAVGKSAFCKRLADEFDFYYVEQPTDEDIFVDKYTQFDVRSMNFRLPDENKLNDRADCLKNPEIRSLSRYQLFMYIKRYQRYQKAMQHLLNTGQGVVLNRCVFSERVFTDALFKMGYMIEPVYEWLAKLRLNTWCDFWRPHLVIYLDASVDQVMENIKKRNDPNEVNSKLLTREFVSNIEASYRENVFPYYQRWSNMITYNYDEVLTDSDWSIIVEDMECMDLEAEEENYFQKEQVSDWCKTDEEKWCAMRVHVSNPDQLKNVLRKMPYCYQGMYMHPFAGRAWYGYDENLWSHPTMRYLPGYSPILKNKGLFWGFWNKEFRQLHQFIKNDVEWFIFAADELIGKSDFDHIIKEH